jgi:hypothetical protein
MFANCLLVAVRLVLAVACFGCGTAALMLAGIVPSYLLLALLSCAGAGLLFMSYGFIAFLFKVKQ